MTLSTNCVWEIRPTTGSDNNGGGFVAGATGTDRSQQAAPQVAIDNGTITTSITGSTVTFTAGYTPTAADVGNVVKFLTGTNVVVSRYQITGQTATTWTLDRTPISSGTTTNATGNMGGAAATIPSVMADVAANGSSGNKYWVKAEATITVTGPIALNAPAANPPTNATMPNRLIGYTATRNDGGRATIQLSSGTGVIVLNATTNGWRIENFVVDCNNLGTSSGIVITHYSVVHNCLVKNFTAVGLGSANAATAPSYHDCEVTGGTAAAAAAIGPTNPANASIIRCNVHNNACAGINLGNNGSHALYNLVTNNTGVNSDGIQSQNYCIVLGNTCYGNGRDGVRHTSAGWMGQAIRNNILAKNSGFGLTLGNNVAGIPADWAHDGNAYWSNTLGARNKSDDTTVNPVNSVAPYTNILDVVLTADPFVNAAGGDFRLNNTAGGGAACRGVGTPGTLPGDTTGVGYPDLGVYQHQDSGGAKFNVVGSPLIKGRRT